MIAAMSALAAEGHYADMDYANLSEYLADMAKRDRREVFSRLVRVMTHLLKWQHQPAKRGKSWETTMRYQRAAIVKRLKRTPSLKPMLSDPEWIEDMWGDAVAHATSETGLDTFQETCPWPLVATMADGWVPPELR